MPKINAESLEAHRSETTERLLDAWGELVLERGYDDVSLAQVAAEAGMTRTAIYNYFPDRESLLFAWTDREVRKTVEELEKALADQESCVDKLVVFVRIELDSFTKSHLPPGREVIHILGRDTFARFMAHIEPVEHLLHDLLDEGIASGEFDPGLDADETVPLIMATIGAERGPMANGKHDLDEATDRVSAFLLRAVGAQPPQRTSGNGQS